MSDAIKKITLQEIYDRIRNRDDSFTDFYFEGDPSAVIDEFRPLFLNCFSWDIINSKLLVIVKNRIEFLQFLKIKLNIDDSQDTPKQDAINPSHYNGTQTLDRMVAVFGVDAVISFCEINAFKYRMRAGNKDGNPIEQDIKKALWYEGKAKELKRKDNE